MSAITWRNVEGRSLAEAAVPLREAGDLMEKGLGTFDRMLQQRNAVQSQNWDNAKVNNTNALKALIASAKTPEELAGLEGQINEMAAGFNGQVDADVLRTGLRDGLTTLRTQATADHAYQKTQRAQTVAPHREAFQQAIAAKNWAAAKQIADTQDLGEDEAALYASGEESVRSRLRQLAADGRADELAVPQHQAALTGLEEQATAVETARQVRQLEKEAAIATQDHRARQDTYGQTLGAIGKAKNLPVDGQGRLRLDLLTSEQYKWLDETISKQLPPGFKGPNILRQYEGGDTEAADAFVTKMAGRVDPAVIEQLRDPLRTRFNTDAGQSIVGREANNVKKLDAQQKVIDDEERASNWHIPGSKDATTDYETIAAELPNLIDVNSGNDVEEDILPMQQFVHEMATKGIDVGGGQMITPSINDLRAVIRGAKGGWFSDSTRANNARKALIKQMKSSGTLEKIKKGEDVRLRDRKRAVDSILKQ